MYNRAGQNIIQSNNEHAYLSNEFSKNDEICKCFAISLVRPIWKSLDGQTQPLGLASQRDGKDMVC